MATPPREDQLRNDKSNDTGADELDPFSEFINDMANDDILNTSGVEAFNTDFAARIIEEVAFDLAHAELANNPEPTAGSGTFVDLENHTTMATSDADPSCVGPASASAVSQPSGSDPPSALNSHDFAETRNYRLDKARRSANKPPPTDAEIIELDSFQAKGMYIKTEGGEDEDVLFVKAEPGVKYFASGFIKWPNTKDEAIEILDDDEPPPSGPPSTPNVQQAATQNDKKSLSPRLEDVAMRDAPAQNVDAPLNEPETAQPLLVEEDIEEPAAPTMPMEIEPVEDATSPLITTSETRSGNEMEVGLATGSNNANPVEEGRNNASSASTSGPNLGRSTSTLRKGPHKTDLRASMREQLKKVQMKASSKTNRGQKVGGGGNSSVPVPPVGPASTLFALPVLQPETSATTADISAPLLPAVTPANSSAPRAPAPEFATFLAEPSSAPAQHFENYSSLEDIVAENAVMDAEMQDKFANKDAYTDDYINAIQTLKDRRVAYRARGEKDEVEEIELMKLQGDLDGWKKRLKEDKQHDQAPEESLFVQDDPYGSDLEALANYNSNSEQLFESELQAKPRGGKNKAGKTPKSKNNNDKVKDKAAKVSKKSAKSKKVKGGPVNINHNMLDVGSLFNSNVIRAAQANQGQRQLPVMDSTRRDLALKQLVASVPLEHRKMALVDKNYLNSACRDFVGRVSVKAVPGNDGWQVSGMTCVLKHHQLLGKSLSQV